MNHSRQARATSRLAGHTLSLMCLAWSIAGTSSMKRTELQQNIRVNTIAHLRLLSSTEEQLQYQRDVPFVNITIELVCGWFDGYYIPEDKAFSSAFSEPELQALADFDQVFDIIAASSLRGEEVPRIESLVQTSEWLRLSQAASVALRVFEHEVGG